jgi:hypothetical protein
MAPELGYSPGLLVGLSALFLDGVITALRRQIRDALRVEDRCLSATRSFRRRLTIRGQRGT